MTDLRLSRAARTDLVDIRLYGVENFGRAADPYFRRFQEVFQLLREHPHAGALQEDLGQGVRCFTHRRHRVFNRVAEPRVTVLRIIHHAQAISKKMLEQGE